MKSANHLTRSYKARKYFSMIKLLFIFGLLFSSGISLANAQQDVPDGCPVDDAQLLAAVANGQKIACTIDYYTGGHGGRWVTVPDQPNAMPTIAEACIHAVETGCNHNPNCVESAYFHCIAQ